VEETIIGIISDTHGLFDPKLPAVFKNCDRILHAGDVGNIGVLQRLRELAPITAVSGNIDEGNSLLDLQRETVVQHCGIRIFMIHILGNPQHLSSLQRCKLHKIEPEVVVFGHSHKAFLETIGNILYFNPGSAGPKRFSLSRTVGLLRLKGGEYRGEIVEI
jgi:putative phosphoesterase